MVFKHVHCWWRGAVPSEDDNLSLYYLIRDNHMLLDAAKQGEGSWINTLISKLPRNNLRVRRILNEVRSSVWHHRCRLKLRRVLPDAIDEHRGRHKPTKLIEDGLRDERSQRQSNEVTWRSNREHIALHT